MMRFLVAALVFATALPAVASAEEMYVISRKSDGRFHASHRLYDSTGANLHEVILCGRPYFVRTATVAWMSYEADEGRSVQLEYNVGKGWVEVCRDPAEQVTLADIGIKDKKDYEVMRASDMALNRAERFKHISKAFSGYKNSGKTSSSYHAR
ncbi:hypothetical protein [Stappia sp.]|uniref:hypothetical protein n=1 Tax=Stappia sp. TaxID=1870903 RepID=UPI0025E7FBDF|nr:hypothetical protein [Stappia sp.]